MCLTYMSNVTMIPVLPRRLSVKGDGHGLLSAGLRQLGHDLSLQQERWRRKPRNRCLGEGLQEIQPMVIARSMLAGRSEE